MRELLRNIMQVLDGVPVVRGERASGQSVVELALVTPILIVLLMGLVEIGWFANNYLILMETTRVGARFGALQVDEMAPQAWPNVGSLIPALQPDAASAQQASLFRDCRQYDNSSDYQRFYTALVCRMLESMDPLPFRGCVGRDGCTATTNGVDDIVVSAFSVAAVNPQDPRMTAAMRASIDLITGLPTNQNQMIVVGRYPTNANECSNPSAGDTRDPFDWIADTTAANTQGTMNFITQDGLRLFYELPGSDPGQERQRGFSLTGAHIVRSTVGGTTCFGSEWTMGRVEDLLNLASYSLDNAERRAVLPSQGVILVEMFWRHSLLLRNPVFNPIFNIMNDPTLDPSAPNDAGTVISVWAAFPLASTEPRLPYLP